MRGGGGGLFSTVNGLAGKRVYGGYARPEYMFAPRDR